ncbi:hypothetical protein LCGC14_1181130 [marine sediment metagenome]|uniref:Uncharacterized protein n=1 Tax=marine sediment metagenome TaxID=412755 RepID=A0A0F9P4Z5_9ZZZZ
MEYLLYAGLGALGGFVRVLITGKGMIALPRFQEVKGSRHLNLGFLVPLVIGAFAGWLAPATLGVNGVVAAIAGYSGSDMVENIIERARRLP